MKLNVYLYSILLLLTTSCSKDFLNREPQDQLSTSGSLANANELRLYMNQYYELFPNHPSVTGGAGVAFDDARTDNLIFTSVNTRLNGKLSISNATALTEYNHIRGLNYFIINSNNAKGQLADIKQYQGEAYFFRAWFYFELLKKYGGVSWVSSLLNLNDESTFIARNTREEVADSILHDLDIAIGLLKTQANSQGMRIHRDVALAFKSRVALYEGTWQKYHKALGDEFFTKGITEEKIKGYLTQAQQAADEIIKSKRWAITSTGNVETDYKNLFITTDLSNNKEVLLWRRYNPAENIGHGVSKYLSTGGGDIGMTLSLVDDYLTRDGRPFVGQERLTAQQVYAAELMPTLRDPRLSQTAAIPGKPIRPGGTVSPYPPINQSGFNRNTTGYPLYKYIEYDNLAATSDDGMSAAPVILFRYAEVLLNYAEATAELAGEESLIIQALQPLRDRVGMPSVNFDREYNTTESYPFRNLNKIIQAIRRERRIEFAAEGMRLDDIMRWAAAGLLIKNKRPQGALFVGGELNQQNTSKGFYKDALLYFDTAPAGKSVNLYLTGTPADAYRYIDPYKQLLPNGYEFNLNRDYLLPIQQRMLELTNQKWEQNPNW